MTTARPANVCRAGPQAERAESARRMLAWYMFSAAAADARIAPWHRRPELPAPPSDVEPQRFDTAANALAWCDDAIDTLLGVCRRARALGFTDIAMHLPLVVAGYLKLRGPRRVWIGLHEMGLQVARGCRDRVAEAWLLHNLATAHFHLGNHSRSARLFQAALEIRHGLGDERGQAWCRLGLGYTLWQQGYPDPRAEGLLRVGLEATCAELGDTESAIAQLMQASAMFTASDDLHGTGLAEYPPGNDLSKPGSLSGSA